MHAGRLDRLTQFDRFANAHALDDDELKDDDADHQHERHTQDHHGVELSEADEKWRCVGIDALAHLQKGQIEQTGEHADADATHVAKTNGDDLFERQCAAQITLTNANGA